MTDNQVTVLVTGGAGYIGSHMSKMLVREGYRVLVLDNCSSSKWLEGMYGILVEADIADGEILDRICQDYSIDAVIHFAAHIDVGESVREPNRYYENNVAKTICLLNGLVRNNVKRVIFSSTASVYGAPESMPISETHPLAPINPYGHSKMVIEQMLRHYEIAHGLKHVVLRYFNAAGADPDGELGENHEPETHLIPITLRVASGRLPHLDLFGNQYDTPDGSGIRDYIHVQDLCRGHLLALQDLMNNGPSDVYNLGNGSGYSVLDVVNTVERVTGCHIPIEVSAPRPSEPPRLVADATKARNYLGWAPELPKLEDMIAHAWEWEQKKYRK